MTLKMRLKFHPTLSSGMTACSIATQICRFDALHCPCGQYFEQRLLSGEIGNRPLLADSVSSSMLTISGRCNLAVRRMSAFGRGLTKAASGQKLPVGTSIQFQYFGPAATLTNGRYSATKLTPALPRPGQELTFRKGLPKRPDESFFRNSGAAYEWCI